MVAKDGIVSATMLSCDKQPEGVKKYSWLLRYFCRLRPIEYAHRTWLQSTFSGLRILRVPSACVPQRLLSARLRFRVPQRWPLLSGAQKSSPAFVAHRVAPLAPLSAKQGHAFALRRPKRSQLKTDMLSGVHHPFEANLYFPQRCAALAGL